MYVLSSLLTYKSISGWASWCQRSADEILQLYNSKCLPSDGVMLGFLPKVLQVFTASWEKQHKKKANECLCPSITIMRLLGGANSLARKPSNHCRRMLNHVVRPLWSPNDVSLSTDFNPNHRPCQNKKTVAVPVILSGRRDARCSLDISSSGWCESEENKRKKIKKRKEKCRWWR